MAAKQKSEPGPNRCPNPNGKYDLTQLLAKLEANQNDFAEFFATKLKLANLGDQNAIACVDSYFEPTDQELQDLGIPASQWGPMRKCTDSGLLVVAKAKEKAPQVFQ